MATENLYIVEKEEERGSNARLPGRANRMSSESGATAPPILAANRISKSFGEIPVLFSIDFDVRPGEVHAVIGENGAGKSTLIKILSGFEQPTSGTISYDGKPVTLPPYGQAEGLGIVLIHQEFNLADHLTVTASIFLGRELKRYGLLDQRAMREKARNLLETLHVNVDPDARINTLSVADKQMVEIAKAISRDARVLIMDEPTADCRSPRRRRCSSKSGGSRPAALRSFLSRTSSTR
jgi:ribose transport system ATP-binding protein